MPPKDKYTNPELRDQVKKELHESDKGGAPGQWSARKAQMMASEYKKRGGEYNTDKETGQDDSQKNLQKWGEEDWQTKEGSGNAKQADGTQKRYLPKKAWEQMDESEKQATDEKKQAESKEGKQFVGNTSGAKQARENANEEENEQFEQKKGQQGKQKKGGKAENAEGVKTKGSGGKKTAGKQEEEEEKEIAEKQDGDDDAVVDDKEEDADEDEEFVEDEDAEDDHEDEDVAEDDDGKEVANGADEKPARGQKRGRGGQKSQGGQNKKQKTNGKENEAQKAGKVGSKHDNPDAPGEAGSATRLPKVGQRVSWKSLPGWVHGKVVEVVTEEKQVGGQHIKGSKKDPRLALEADSGKMCQHKPATTFFNDE